MKLRPIDKPEVLEQTFRKLIPSASEIKVRGTTGVDVTMPDGFVLQIVKEDYGVRFYIEEKPLEYLLIYEIAGEEHKKTFHSQKERDTFESKLPEGVARQEVEPCEIIPF